MLRANASHRSDTSGDDPPAPRHPPPPLLSDGPMKHQPPCEGGSAVMASVATYVRRRDAHDAVLAELWGEEPPYVEQDEDRSSWLVGTFFFTWLGDFMHRAAAGDVRVEDLPHPTRPFRARCLGLQLSREMRRQWEAEHKWDCLEGVRVRYVGHCESPWRRCVSLLTHHCFGRGVGAGYASCVPVGTEGTLRYVGNPQQYRRRWQRFVGVEWDLPAGAAAGAVDGGAAVIDVSPASRGGGGDGPEPGEPHDGTVGGEHLFTLRTAAAAGGEDSAPALATCEPVEAIEFVDPPQVLQQYFTITPNENSHHSNNAAAMGGSTPANEPSSKTSINLFPPPRGMSMAHGLLRALGNHLVVAGPFRLLRDLSTVTLPIILKVFIEFMQEVSDTGHPNWGRGFLLVVALGVVSVLQCLLANRYFTICFRCGFAFRSALSSLVFEKCLTIANKAFALPYINQGRITNMVSNDCEHVVNFCIWVWTMLGSFIQLAVSVGILYTLLGWSVFAGLFALVLSMPAQYILTTKIFQGFDEKAAATDARLRATSEFISGMRVAKFMSWEPAFMVNIEEKRNAELGKLKYLQRLFVLTSLVDGGLPTVAIAVMLVTYTLQGHPLTAAIAFPVIALLDVLSMPFHCVPMFISSCTQYVVATNRITRFLSCANAEDRITALTLDGLVDEAEDESRSRPGRKEAEGYLRKRYAAVFEHAGVSAFLAEPLPSFDTGANGTSTAAKKKAAKKKPKDPAAAAAPEESGSDSDEEDDTVYQLRPKELLHGVSLRVPRGKLTVVVGATGSGKSTLLDSLIGAVDVTSGRVLASRSVAYVPQQPWIMNATVRENVLFFSEMEGGRFERALDCSQLRSDLALLAGGLETEIGEKGINLSGGQKARVSLARAVYADRELYLLDDPLSALDAHVGDKVMRECVLGELRGKTRILATHQVHFAALADYVVVLDGGRIVFQGDARAFAVYEDMVGDLPGLGEGGEGRQGEEGECGSPTGESLIDQGSPIMAAPPPVAPQADETHVPGATCPAAADAVDGTQGEPAGEAAVANVEKLIEDEEMAEGSVPIAIYWRYCLACGGVVPCVVLLVLHAVTECMMVAPTVWLMLWSSNVFVFQSENMPVYIFLVLVTFNVMSDPLRRIVTFPILRSGGKAMHEALLASVSSATLPFFDTTPLGRVLNRFSKDIELLDVSLIDDVFFTGQNLFGILSSLIIMIITQPFVLFALVPTGYLYYRLTIFFAAANRTIRRHVNVANAPVVSLATTILGGRWTISSGGAGPHMMQEALRRLDHLFATHYVEICGEYWLTVRVTVLSAIITTTLAFLGSISVNYSVSSRDSADDGAGTAISVGLISLSITMSMNVNLLFTQLIGDAAHVEADMNSVERLVHYTDAIPHEDIGPAIAEAVRAHREFVRAGEAGGGAAEDVAVVVSDAPVSSGDDTGAGGVGAFSPKTRRAIDAEAAALTLAPVRAGTIEFAGVDMRYRPGLPLVLRGVSFRVGAGEKVGVVGRTGSGKSTLLLAFLRLVEVCGGEVRVCGRAAVDYDLRALRRLFSMIPQDPLLFDGTVRSNVDPFGEATDAACWAALGHVGMAARVRGEAGGLLGRVSEGGSNFSVGQRQLLCLARALLKKGSAFLLMDEATANVDPALDRQIQETVARTFRAYTVITIAHRLHTVAAYDTIVMMDGGRVVACGSPRALVSDAASPFAALVRSMGEEAQRKFMQAMK